MHLGDPSDLAARRTEEIIRVGTVQVALCDLWLSHGVVPDFAFGVSGGEIIAAHAAGVLSVEHAVSVFCAVAIERTPAPSVMFGVGLGWDATRRLCAVAPVPVEYPGTWGWNESYVHCAAEDARALHDFLVDAGVLSVAMPLRWRYHLPHSAAPLPVMAATLAAMEPGPAGLPLYSAAAAGELRGARFDPIHWHWLADRQFFVHEALAEMLAERTVVAINVGIRPDLQKPVTQVAEQVGAMVTFINAVNKQSPDADELWARALNEAQVLGLTQRSGETRPSVRPVAAATSVDLDARSSSRDPFRIYRELRPGGAVQYLDRHRAWIVLGDAEVREALATPEVFAGEQGACTDAAAADALAPARAALAACARGIVETLGPGEEHDVVEGFAAEAAKQALAALRGGDDAGAGFTTSLSIAIASAVRLLAEDPALQDRVRTSADRLDAFAGEALRLHPPRLLLERTTMAPAELGVTELPAGAAVLLCVGAANRDPARFEAPDEFRFDRANAAADADELLRVLTRDAVAALLDCAPQLSAAQPACFVRWRQSATVHTLDEFLITAA